MAYLQDFYPLDIDDSYVEYVTSELKYDDSDILLLDDNPIVKFQTSYEHGALSPLISSHESSKY